MEKEEPLINSVRGIPSSLEETTGSLSRPGRTALARIKQPALSPSFEFRIDAVVDASNIEPALLRLLGSQT